MTTIKEILSENRVSVINNIKWFFKTKNQSEIIDLMKMFLSYCEKNTTFEKLSSSKRIKTDLKNLVFFMFTKDQSETRRINDSNSMVEKWNKLTEEEKSFKINQHSHDLQLEIRNNTRNRWGI